MLNIIEKLKIRYVLYKNKKALTKLSRSLEEYNNVSKVLIESIDEEHLWTSGIAEEEIVIRKFENIVERRLLKLTK